MLTLELGVVAFLIVLNGFFAMAELAVVSSRRPRLAAMAEAGSAGARAALGLLENQARFLSSVQIGITLIGVLTGAFGGATLAEDLAGQLETLGLGPAPQRRARCRGGRRNHLPLADRRRARAEADRARQSRAHRRVRGAPDAGAGPRRRARGVAARGIVPARLAPARARRRARAAGHEEEIRTLIAEAESAGVVETARDAHDRAGDAPRRPLRARLMTPRPEVDWVDLDQELPAILARLRASPHSRLPAARDGIDWLLGVLHAKDTCTTR